MDIGLSETISHTPSHSSENLPPEQWVEAFGDLLYRYALVRVGDEVLAEDLVQETFLAAIKSKYSPASGAQVSWFKSILQNQIYEFYRKQTRRTGLLKKLGDSMRGSEFFDEEGNWTAGRQPAPPPGKQLESSEVWGLLKGCLSKLPEGLSSVFVLSVMDGLDTQSVCKELEITKENFWTRMHRARVILADCLSNKLKLDS